MTRLGRILNLGKGVPSDPKAALAQYQAAAKANYGPAQYYLGMMYATGRGTDKNVDEARQ